MNNIFFENLYDYLVTAVRNKDLSFQQIRVILILALDDYFAGKINVDTLSLLCVDLISNIGYNENDFPPDLNLPLGAGVEIEWYSKNKDKSKSNKEWHEHWLENLKTFYEENKDILKNFKDNLK